MAENLKSGDIVYFPSHPNYEMTVETVENSTYVTVVWFHPVTKDFITKRVNAESLVKK